MKISRNDASVVQVDKSTIIEKLFDDKDFAFDVVIGKLDGHHPKRVNYVSDRAYFILSGELIVHIGEESYTAHAHDLITIPKSTPHGLDGKGEYLIITSPPFTPKNEQELS